MGGRCWIIDDRMEEVFLWLESGVVDEGCIVVFCEMVVLRKKV